MFVTGVHGAEAGEARACVEALLQNATHQFGTARDIADGPVVLLEGDTRLRLAGLAIPALPRNRDDAIAADSAASAKAYLRSLITGSRLRAAPAIRKDRRGRQMVQLIAAAEGEGAPKWVQAEMVRAGQARVWPTRHSTACAAWLLQLEAEARRAKHGLWALRRNAVVEAWATRKLRARENTFQLVEGAVQAVAETKRFTYLNFGKDWRTDFTAAITARTAKRLKNEGFSFAGLKGKRIRVRGWVRYANGPSISVSVAEQIEVLDAAPK